MHLDSRARSAYLALAVLFLVATLLMALRMQNPAGATDEATSAAVAATRHG
jgi:hypothetical protein